MAKVKNKSDSEDKAPKIDFEASIIEANYYRDNPFLPSKNTVIAYTEDMVKEIARCKKDIIYFAQNYFTIVNLDRGKEIVKLYQVQKKILKQMVDNNRVVIVSSRQMGKALGLDTPIPTPNGFTTMGQLKDNDEVYDENGSICHVVKAHDVLYGRKCYKVTFDNGEEIVADAEHLWRTITDGEESVKTTQKIKDTFALNHKLLITHDFTDSFGTYVRFESIEEIESVPVRCITVDSPNSLYLCGNTYIPTHNTTMFSIFALWYTSFFNDKTILIVANKEKTATEILSRVRTAFELLPAFLKPAIKEWQKQSIEFINGSKILITSSSSTAGRSASCNVLLIDECAHLLDHQADEFFTSVLPVISSSKNTKLFLASTPNGQQGYFYRTYKQATEVKGGCGWTYAKVPWYDIPGRDAKWKEIALADVNYNMAKFKQEYECDFHESSESAIDPQLLAELTENLQEPEILNTPEYKVWEKPDRRKIYSIGCDVSDGVGGCASCIQVFDITDLRDIKQVACFNDRYIDTTSFASKIHEIAKQWGKPWLMIEKNAMGHEIISLLSNKPYNYERILGYNDKDKENTIKPGIMSSTNTKYISVSNMRYWINTSRTVTIRDKDTLSEMRTFTKQENGTWKKRKGEGIYDDRVMATCWALFPLVTSIANKIYDVVEFGSDGKPTKVTNTYFEDLEDSDFNMANLKTDVFRDDDDGFIGGMIPYRTNPNLNEGVEDLMMSGWSLQ